MQHATILGGFGGQGLLFAGHVLAEAGVIEDRNVSWMPSYGPEMRGGTASCTVIIADGPIGSPVVDAADSVVALNLPSLIKYGPLLVPGGLLVLNSSLIESGPQRDDIETVLLPCTALARLAGDDRLVSVAALGGLIARRPIVSPKSIRTALIGLIGRDHERLIAADLAAFSGAYERALIIEAAASSSRSAARTSLTSSR